jgi:polyhydroxyalkanoate synthesis repressor PhaR
VENTTTATTVTAANSVVAASAREPKIIKRYQNRKLYDTHQSCYVTLDEIAKMIRNGDELKVIDNKTQRDITSSTLTQLLFETEKKSNKDVPISLLKEIIRTGDGSFSGYILSKGMAQGITWEPNPPRVEPTVQTGPELSITN